MKKLFSILAALIAISTIATAQNTNERNNTGVIFYGVDFTAVNVRGAKETHEQFLNAFERINWLMTSEPLKYDTGKYLNLDVIAIDIKVALEQIEDLWDTRFKDIKPQEIPIAQIISDYPVSDENGLIIIAKELNKNNARGTFIAVLFDGITKEILFQEEFSGKASGIGLRNFWANSLYDGLKNAR